MVALYVLLGFILLIIIDASIMLAEKKLHPAFIKGYEVNEFVVSNKVQVKVPVDIYISKGHTWAENMHNGNIRIGVDDFAIKSLGDVKVKSLIERGTVLKKGEKIIGAEVGGKSINFYSPIDGVVKDINDELIEKQLTDVYGEGWGLVVSPLNFESSKAMFKINDEVVSWLKTEFARLKDYISVSFAQNQLAGQTMYDGGTLVENFAGTLDQEKITEFEKEFLSM